MCTGHRPPCPGNRPYTLSSDYGTVNGAILASDIERLRQDIRLELAALDIRWPGRVYTQGSAISANATSIQAAQINELDYMVAQRDNDSPASGTPAINPDTYTPAGDNVIINAAGNTILATHWADISLTDLLERYEQMRTNCICNSDCACNAVCACNGDCGCNYSDRRLKQEITYW